MPSIKSMNLRQLFVRRILLVLILAFLFHAKHVQPLDNTLEEMKTGYSLVETVIQKLELKGVHRSYDELLFLRRLAYVESRDGNDTDVDTFRKGYYGGIWQVDHGKYIVTLDYPNTRIQVDGIVWSSMSWEDLTKPFYSAVVALSYFRMLAAQPNVDPKNKPPPSIPTSVEDQAAVWQRYYRPDKKARFFIDRVKDLDDLSKCKSIGADILILLDLTSNNVTQQEFVADQVSKVVSYFGIGTNQFGLVFIRANYAGETDRRIEYDFGKYTSATDFNTAMNSTILSETNGTDTLNDYDFNRLRWNSFASPKKDRIANPKVVVILPFKTNAKKLTQVSAAENYYSNITAIPVDTSLADDDTRKYSNPYDFFHVSSSFDNTNAAEVIKINYILKKRICLAPVILSSLAQTQLSISATNGPQPCRINSPTGSGTVTVTTTGGAATFYILNGFFPSEHYYKEKIVVDSKQNGSVSFTVTDNKNLDVYHMYCAVASDSSQTVTITVVDNVQDSPLIKLSEGSPKRINILSAGHQKCEIFVTGNLAAKNYSTVQISTQSGGTTTLYVSSYPHITSENVYDNKTTSQPGKPGFVTIDTSDFYGISSATFYCHLVGDKYQHSNVVIEVMSNDANICKHSHCLNGGACFAISSVAYNCSCNPQYAGQYCEIENSGAAVYRMSILLTGLMLLTQKLF